MSNPVERSTSLPTLGNEVDIQAPRQAPPPPRRASRTIMLALVGVGIAAVGYGVWSSLDEGEEEVAQQRNGYASQQECEANYSKEQCTQGQTHRPGMGFMPIFWGPFYGGGNSLLGRPPNDPGPGRVSRGTVIDKQVVPSTSRRGGFGSSGASRSGSIGG
jgi:uncharacterized protein YgiB involved in biofilm formation